MRLKVNVLGEGLHPSELVVEVKTSDGVANLVIDHRALDHGSVGVGAPVGVENDLLLVELPRETTSGAWRVWVQRDQLAADRRAGAA